MRAFIAGLLLMISTSASAAPLHADRFKIVLELAREYAADRTLILYCFRRDAETTPFLWAAVHFDIEDALKHLKLFSDDRKQHAELVSTVLGNVRGFAANAQDAALEAQCKAKNVEDDVATFNGVGRPLITRPPFDRIGR